MDIITAPGGIINTDRPGQGIIDVTKAGFQNIVLELEAFCGPWELENFGKEEKPRKIREQNSRKRISEHPGELCGRAKELADQYQKGGICTPIAKAPYLLRNTKREDLRGLLSRLAKESIRACAAAHCQTLILRPLVSGITKEHQWQANRDYCLSLLPAARENHVQILLENQCRDINGHLTRGICSDPQEAAAWIDRLNQEAGEERFGFCMNVGTCSICGQNMQEFARTLGHRVKTVILRDCDGQKEMSLLPFTCPGPGGQPRTDWLGLIRGLREIHFDGQLILDFADTAAAFSPLLRPELMRLAKAAAEYFRWQIGMENILKKYGSVALFGAGNMCRNYMKCYGEKYPPLFTCDNNRELWGTMFCGLEVKPPESLKTLSEDCAILICNIYYREIEQQLKSMGIRNTIGFFNDEYMPSFYFDRLEGR